METAAPPPLEHFADQLLSAPWGSLSKSELEYLAFELLVAADRIRLDVPDFELAGALRISTARARNLRFRLEQRRFGALDPTRLAAAITVHAAAESGMLLVQIDGVYYEEYLLSALRARQYLVRRKPDGLISVAADDLSNTLLGVLGDNSEVLDALKARIGEILRTQTASERKAGFLAFLKDLGVSIARSATSAAIGAF